MNRNRPIRRTTKPRTLQPGPAPAPAPAPSAQEMGAWFHWALAELPPTWESGGHE